MSVPLSSLLTLIGHGSASGRLDVMGGVADYSGSFVLEMPIRGRTNVEVTCSSHPIIRCESVGFDHHSFNCKVWHQMINKYVKHFTTSHQKPNLTSEHAFLASIKLHLEESNVPGWCRYVLGCLTVFCARKLWTPPSPGLSFVVRSEVNASMGVSSSAAIEVATLRAISSLAQHASMATTGESNDTFAFVGTELAHLGQLAENRIVGAPCGLMDQLSVAFGEPNHLLPILCRPDTLYDNIKLPAGVSVIGWPSGIKHSVGESPYLIARTASFMGKKMMEHVIGTTVKFTAEFTPAMLLAPVKPLTLSHEPVHVSATHDAHQPYQSRISQLPISMLGADFLRQYVSVDDPLSTVKPDIHYPVRDAFSFPVHESFRCQTVASLLTSISSVKPAKQEETLPGEESTGLSSPVATRESVLHTIGELLYQSHRGYSLMGLGCPETDSMISILQSMRDVGVYGGRISGGGSGGTVIVLCEHSAVPLVRAQVKAFHSSSKLDIIQA